MYRLPALFSPLFLRLHEQVLYGFVARWVLLDIFIVKELG